MTLEKSDYSLQMIISSMFYLRNQFKKFKISNYSLSAGVWQSFVTIRSYNHLMRIISRYVDNTKKSEIS